jgi:hypothetical protein
MSDKLRMTVVSLAGRTGRFLVIDDNGTLSVVARIQGASEPVQRRAELLLAQWCLETGRSVDPLETWCEERAAR